MIIIRNDIEQANKILTEFDGASARLWSYSSTFNVMEIMLDFIEYEYIVIIIFTDCNFFKGELDWSNSVLRISENNGITEMNDFKSDFQIKAGGGFILKKGTPKEFFGDPPADIPELPWEKE